VDVGIECEDGQSKMNEGGVTLIEKST